MRKIFLCVNLFLLSHNGHAVDLPMDSEIKDILQEYPVVQRALKTPEQYRFFYPQKYAERLDDRLDRVREILYSNFMFDAGFDIGREIRSIEEHLDCFLADVNSYNILEQEQDIKEIMRENIQYVIAQKIDEIDQKNNRINREIRDIEALQQEQENLTREIASLDMCRYGIGNRMMWLYNLPLCDLRITRLENFTKEARQFEFRN